MVFGDEDLQLYINIYIWEQFALLIEMFAVVLIETKTSSKLVV